MKVEPAAGDRVPRPSTGQVVTSKSELLTVSLVKLSSWATRPLSGGRIPNESALEPANPGHVDRCAEVEGRTLEGMHSFLTLILGDLQSNSEMLDRVVNEMS